MSEIEDAALKMNPEDAKECAQAQALFVIEDTFKAVERKRLDLLERDEKLATAIKILAQEVVKLQAVYRELESLKQVIRMLSKGYEA